MEDFDLSEFFKTKIQASDFSVRLAVVSEGVYKTGFNLEETLSQQFGLQKKDKFMILLREHGIAADSPSDLKGFLDKLQERIAALPVLSITVAIELNDQILRTLSEWFFLQVKRQVLFDVTVDPSIIAGAVISYNGKQKDFSIKSTFMQVIQEAADHNGVLPAPGSDETPPPYGKHLGIEAMHVGR